MPILVSMGRNSYPNASVDDTLHHANQIIALAGQAPGDWGLTPAQITALTGTSIGLNSENVKVIATRQASLAATQNRAMKDRACKDVIAAIARALYADPETTPDQLRSLGFEPRKTDRTKIVPVTPAGLSTKIDANGDLSLVWKRNGNAAGVIFRVEELGSDGVWSFADETTACRISLSGYALGTPVAFRIVATKNGLSATPTGMVSVYQTAVATPTLHIAA